MNIDYIAYSTLIEKRRYQIRNLFILLLLLTTGYSNIVDAQDSTKILFNEFSVSANYSQVTDGNTQNRFGFGAGAHHVMGGDKIVNPIIGIEFNQIHQFKETIYIGRFARSEDVTYQSNFLSIPLGLRIVEPKTNVFVEIGGFADIALSANQSGTLITDLPSNQGRTVKQFDEKAQLQSYAGIYIYIYIYIYGNWGWNTYFKI